MMRKGYLPALLVLSSIMTACGGGTALPDPTGKASIRAINAIPGSPAIEFLIEEITIANIGYQSVSSANRYDDFTYNFNFEVRFAGETQDRRIVTQTIDFEADADYTLVLTGTLSNPAVTLWESVERNFDSNATVFQARFAHTSGIWGDIDVYFAPDGTTPVPGEQAATLSQGDISAPIDFEGGDYAVIVTVAKNPGDTVDPADILYTSTATTINAQSNFIVSTFDGTADNVAPVLVRLLGDTGTSVTLPDPSYLPQIEFMHAAFDLGDVDVYDDDMLTSQVLTAHAYTEITPPMSVAAGSYTYRYTPTGDTTLLFETPLDLIGGVKYRLIALGSGGNYLANPVFKRLAPFDNGVKVVSYQASVNYAFLNLYTVDRGGAFEESTPIQLAIPAGSAVDPIIIQAGDYDLYVTETGESDVLAGPVSANVAIGDVLELVIFDTADPAVMDLRIINQP